MKRKQPAPVRNGTLVVRTVPITVTDLTIPVQQGLLPLPAFIEQGVLGILSIVFFKASTITGNFNTPTQNSVQNKATEVILQSFVVTPTSREFLDTG
jgi:hypothetical protein